MFASLDLSDKVAEIDPGMAMQALATGTTSGSAISLASTPNRKLQFRWHWASGSAAASVSMYLASATASAGAYTSIASTSQSLAISASTPYLHKLNTRGEFFADLRTGALWVKPVTIVSGGGGTALVHLEVLGYLSGHEPADNFNSATLAVSELSAY